MMKRYGVIFWVSLVLVGALFGGAPKVQAQTKWEAGCVGNGELSKDVATIQGVACLIRNTLNVVIPFLGFVAFAMFIYAGFKLLISGGQPNHLESAKSTLLYAIFGMLLALSAYVILNLVAQIVGESLFKIEFSGNDSPNVYTGPCGGTSYGPCPNDGETCVPSGEEGMWVCQKEGG